MSGVYERPFSPTDQLAAASLALEELDKDSNPLQVSELYRQMAEACHARGNPQAGCYLAAALNAASSDDATSKKVIDLVKRFFSPLNDDQEISADKREILRDEVTLFVQNIAPYLENNEIDKEPDFFQFIGTLYDCAGDHRRSKEMYCEAATNWLKNDSTIPAAKVLGKAAEQTLLVDPESKENRQTAAALFETAGDFHCDQGQVSSAVIYYEEAEKQYAAMKQFAQAGELAEKRANLYNMMTPSNDDPSRSMAQASQYYALAGDKKRAAACLELAALYAREHECEGVADLYQQAGCAFAQMEDHPSAARCFVAAAEAHEEKQKKNECYERALFHCDQQGDSLQALSLYNKIGVDEQNESTRIEYVERAANRLVELKRHEEAAEHFKEVAMYCEEKKEFLLAAHYFEKVLEYDDDASVKILDRAAKAYQQGGQYIQALDCCTRGLEESGWCFWKRDWLSTIEECLNLFARQLPSSGEERTLAAESLKRIAKAMKGRRETDLLGRIYQLAAQCEDVDLVAAALFEQAAKYCKWNQVFTMSCYQQALERYLRQGCRSYAARLFRKIASIHHEDLEAAKAYVSAAEHTGELGKDLLCLEEMKEVQSDYANAARLYCKEDCVEEALRCFVCAAGVSSELEHHEAAGNFFENAANLGLADSNCLLAQAAEQWSLAAQSDVKNKAFFPAAQLFESAAAAYCKCSLYAEAATANFLAADHYLAVSLESATSCALQAAECCAKMEPIDHERAAFAFAKAAHLQASSNADLAVQSLKKAEEHDQLAGGSRSYLRELLGTPRANPSALIPFSKEAAPLLALGGYFVKAMSLYGQILVEGCWLDQTEQEAMFQKMETCLLQCEQLSSQPRSIEQLVKSLVWAAQGFERRQSYALAAKACRLASKWALQTERNDREKTAVGYLEQAMDLYRTSKDAASEIEVCQELGALYLPLGKNFEAASAFERIADLYSEELQRSNEAVSFYRKAADLFKQADYGYQAACCYSKAAHILAAAELPNHRLAGSLYEQAAKLSDNTDYYDKAIEEFETIREITKKDELCKIAALRFSSQGEGKKAARMYSRISSDDQDWITSVTYLEQAAANCSKQEAASYWMSIAVKYARNQMYQRAAQAYQSAAEAYCKNSEAAMAYEYAKTYYLKVRGCKKEAADCCLKVAECFADRDNSKASDYFKQAGELYISVDVSLACDCFEKAVDYETRRGLGTSIITCFEEMFKKSIPLMPLLKKAAERFMHRKDFALAMGVYGQLLVQNGYSLSSEERADICLTMKQCLQEYKKWPLGRPFDALIRAAKGFLREGKGDLAARSYRLASRNHWDKDIIIECLEKAIELYEENRLVPSQLKVSKELATLYKHGGAYAKAAILFEEIGGVYQQKLGLYTEAADCFEEAGICYKVFNTSKAASCYNQAAANWQSLSMHEQTGHCLEQMGLCLGSSPSDEAIQCFARAREEFGKLGRKKRVEACSEQAAKHSSSLGRGEEAAHFYSKIRSSSDLYDEETHLTYLEQAISEPQTLEETLSTAGYYSEMGDVYQRMASSELSEGSRKKSALLADEWIRRKTDQLRAVLTEPRQHKYVQEWVEQMLAVGKLKWMDNLLAKRRSDGAIDHLRKGSFQGATAKQIRALFSNCHPDKYKGWLKDHPNKKLIQEFFDVLRAQIQQAKEPAPAASSLALTNG